MPGDNSNDTDPPLRRENETQETAEASVAAAESHETPPQPSLATGAKNGKGKGKRKKKPRKRPFRPLTLAVALLSAIFVGSQVRETWRQSQLTYLQTRSQDFLQQEFDSESMGCLYDWWTPRARSQTRQPAPRHALSGTPADTQCYLLRTNYAEYSDVMLYIEETLMYFVEEARVTCSNGVNYGRELEIWRQDVSWDSSGAFSFYILSRFADPNLGYVDPPPSRDVVFTPQESVRRYLEQARLFDVTLPGLCRNAQRFRESLQFATREESWVTDICENPAETFSRTYPTDNIFDTDYCRDVHYVEPTISRRLSSLVNTVDRWGRYLP